VCGKNLLGKKKKMISQYSSLLISFAKLKRTAQNEFGFDRASGSQESGGFCCMRQQGRWVYTLTHNSKRDHQGAVFVYLEFDNISPLQNLWVHVRKRNKKKNLAIIHKGALKSSQSNQLLISRLYCHPSCG